MKSKINLKPLLEKINSAEKKTSLAANREIQREFKNKFLNLISKGISPINGEARFTGYKNPKKYPASKKRPRPVNLKLSGKFLREFSVTLKRFNVLEYGFFSQYGKNLEEGHRIGQNSQLKRPIIPQGNEKLVYSLEALILKIFKKYFR